MATKKHIAKKEADIAAMLKDARARITQQDTFISELQMERNEAKAATARVNQELESMLREQFIEAPVMVTAYANACALKGLVRNLIKERDEWEEKAQQQSIELYHLRQAVKAAGTLADNVNALLKVLNVKGGK